MKKIPNQMVSELIRLIPVMIANIPPASQDAKYLYRKSCTENVDGSPVSSVVQAKRISGEIG
ncbi:MAG: hypothetical protein RR280_08640, partial [Bacteroidaceae bacterium]